MVEVFRSAPHSLRTHHYSVDVLVLAESLINKDEVVVVYVKCFGHSILQFPVN